MKKLFIILIVLAICIFSSCSDSEIFSTISDVSESSVESITEIDTDYETTVDTNENTSSEPSDIITQTETETTTLIDETETTTSIDETESTNHVADETTEEEIEPAPFVRLKGSAGHEKSKEYENFFINSYDDMVSCLKNYGQDMQKYSPYFTKDQKAKMEEYLSVFVSATGYSNKFFESYCIFGIFPSWNNTSSFAVEYKDVLIDENEKTVTITSEEFHKTMGGDAITFYLDFIIFEREKLPGDFNYADYTLIDDRTRTYVEK